MRIVGVGTDITEIERIDRMLKKHGDFFLRRVFTPGEARYCGSGRKSAERYASRWAVKEAVMKALGTGWSEGVNWTEIEVVRDAAGKPELSLSGGAKSYAESIGIVDWKITISHCDRYAVAFAVATAES
ncbi:MAG: holo-ACP synthase [Thermoguttaceae bacterium]|jgi:holo-[acyl-carrier protein] synthase